MSVFSPVLVPVPPTAYDLDSVSYANADVADADDADALLLEAVAEFAAFVALVLACVAFVAAVLADVAALVSDV